MKKMNLLLTVFTTIFVFNINAQIIYTDINPDGQPAGLDFNGDGSNEFDITTENKLGDYIGYYSYGADNNIHAVGDQNDGWDTPAFVAQGFTIDASNNWQGQGDAYPNGDWSASGTNPTIIPNTDQYMAVKFNLGGTDVYYGWVRVNINANGDVTYKDYAYESTANTAIVAGAMPTASTNSVSLNSFNVFPNPCKDILNIQTDKEISSIAIYTLNGQLILKEEIKNTNSVNVSKLSNSLYFVKVNNSFIKFIKE